MKQCGNNIGRRFNRTISRMLVLMIFSLILSKAYVVHAVDTLPKYTKAYTIGNVLSDYQYFVQGDFKGENGSHTVGALAVGGALDTVVSVGDGQVAASYVKEIKRYTNDFSQGQWLGDSTYRNKNFYYDTIDTDSGVATYLLGRFTNNPGYIDFTAAFNSLRQESSDLANKGTASYSVNGGNLTITLDSTKDTFVTIPYSKIKSATSIEIAGLSSVQDFVNHKYVISCTGVESNDYALSFTNVKFNGDTFNNKLKTLLGGTDGSQLNLNGMKLVWNFPDATGIISAEGLSGHLVAPQANVKAMGGNFEGGIIAKSVNTNSEGHYYAFYAPGTIPESAPIVNAAPKVDNYQYTIKPNEVINKKVVGTDENIGDTLTYAKSGDPTHGTVKVNSDGSYTYTPTTDYVGVDSFKVTVTDEHGASAISTITVTIEAAPIVNVAPKVDNYQYTIKPNEVINKKVVGTDENIGDTLTYAKSGDPTHGTVKVNSDGSYTYTPNTDYVGVDSFKVTVSDGHGESATSTVTVTIEAAPIVNVAPKVDNYQYTITTNKVIIGKVVGTDENNEDTLTYAISENPTHGTVTVDPDGSYTYTPEKDYVGVDSFKVIVSDGHNGSTISTVNVKVVGTEEVKQDVSDKNSNLNNKDQNKLLPQAGKFVDFTVLMSFGVLLILFGLAYKFRRKVSIK